MAKKNKVYKICQKCLKECNVHDINCSCGNSKFAPEYVKKIAKINRQFSVQVTEIAEQFRTKGKPDQRITLYKWWPGNKSSLHINQQEEWDSIKNIIDQDFSKFLGWKTKKEILSKIEQGDYINTAKDLSTNYPEFVNEIISGINFKNIKENDLPQVVNAINSLINALKNADESFVIAIKQIIEKLPSQGKRAIEDLGELLKQWSLRQITAISNEIKYRIDTIEILEKAILDDKTYEINGDGSVHRILENAMWLVDERYLLMHSNKTLRTIIGDKLSEKNKKFQKKRPDFVCGTIDKKLIIVELKRPSHELTIDDLQQLETYMLIIEEHSGEKYNFEGYLVGKRISEDLSKRLKFRGGQFKVKTYSDLLDDVKKRYTDFYKKL